MSDEIQLRLQLLQLANGNTERAKEMLDFALGETDPSSSIKDEYEAWAAGDKSKPPEWDSELYEIFDNGISYAIKSLAYLLDVKHYTPCDGSETLEGDVSGTLANILIAAGYRTEDGDLAKPHEIAQTAPAIAALSPAPSGGGEALGWEPIDAFKYPASPASLEGRWADGHIEALTFAGYTPTTNEPRWMHTRKSEAGGVHPDSPTHLRVLPSEPAAEAKGAWDVVADQLSKMSSEDAAKVEEAIHPGAPLDAFQEPETRAGDPDWQNNPNVEIVSGEPWPMPSAYETTLTITTDNTAALPPLLPPEPPPAATPEQLEAVGVVDPMASFWARKLTKEPA